MKKIVQRAKFSRKASLFAVRPSLENTVKLEFLTLKNLGVKMYKFLSFSTLC